MISASERDVRWSLVLADAVAFWLALPLTMLLSHRFGVWREYFQSGAWSGTALTVALTVLWYGCLREVGAYEPHRASAQQLTRVLKGTLLFSALLTAIAFFSWTRVSRAVLLLFVPVVVVVATLLRLRLSPLLLRLVGSSGLRVLVLGEGEAAKLLESDLKQRVELHVLRVDFNPNEHPGSLNKLLNEHQPHEVLVACERCSSGALTEVLNACQEKRISWEFVPAPDQMVFSDTVAHVMAGIPLVAVRTSAVSGFNLLLKRGFDLVISSVVVVVISPMLAAIWTAIRLTSPGPAIFRQERVGFKGRRFQMYKFRSMYVDSDDRLHRDYVKDWIQEGSNAANGTGLFKIADDNRITPIGCFLRRYSLDELPQIFNVLKGDMSLVGPRPALAYELDAYRRNHLERLETPPGITGLWQVNGRNAVSFDRMVQLDIEYARSWSLRSDLSILVRTVPAVFLGTGH